jgi:hypothetical protein
LFTQIAALFLSWKWHWLVFDESLFTIAAIIAVVGCAGGVLMRWQKQGIGKGKPTTGSTFVQLLTSVLVTVGAYLVFVPTLAIIAHGGWGYVLLVVGFVAPSLLTMLPFPSRKTVYPPG